MRSVCARMLASVYKLKDIILELGCICTDVSALVCMRVRVHKCGVGDVANFTFYAFLSYVEFWYRPIYVRYY